MQVEFPRNAERLATAFALLTVAFVAWSAYAIATVALPPLAANRGRIDEAITLNLIVSGVVFLGAHLALVLILMRRPREARIPRENMRVEVLWTVIPIIVQFRRLSGGERVMTHVEFSKMPLWLQTFGVGKSAILKSAIQKVDSGGRS